MAVDGRRIGSADDFNKAVAQVLPGQRVQIVVKRGEQVLTLEITAGE
jgi:S1-C subfamily serine protease